MSLTDARLTEASGMRGLEAGANRVTEDYTTSLNPVYGDDFNRADGTLGAGWDPNANPYGVLSNRCYKVAGGTDWARFLTDIGGADHWVEADVANLGAGSAYVCVDVRMDASLGNNCYFAYIHPDTGYPTISKMVSSSFSEIANSGSSVGLADCKLRLEAEGTALRLYRNDTLVLSTTDSSHTTGGFAGINTNYTTTVYYDNFRCGLLPYTAP